MNLNRRGFLKGLIGGVAVAAAAQSFPFRVYSFPTEIHVPKIGEWCCYNVKFTTTLPPDPAFIRRRIIDNMMNGSSVTTWGWEVIPPKRYYTTVIEGKEALLLEAIN